MATIFGRAFEEIHRIGGLRGLQEEELDQTIDIKTHKFFVLYNHRQMFVPLRYHLRRSRAWPRSHWPIWP